METIFTNQECFELYIPAECAAGIFFFESKFNTRNNFMKTKKGFIAIIIRKLVGSKRRSADANINTFK